MNMNILSIGNSFSQDAQRYLHRIAESDGVCLDTVNLCIGGCALSTHYDNMIQDQKAYTLEINGESTDSLATLKETLLDREWDVVTLQQVSQQSPYYDTYQPYLDKICAFVRECAPKAKIAIHQTWAYEQDSHRLNVELGYEDQSNMFRDIKTAYEKAAKAINADYIIPSGEVFQKLIAAGIQKVHRDTFHASYGIGRYALGLLWYKILTGNSIENNKFCNFDEEISEHDIQIVKKCVNISTTLDNERNI